MFINFPSLDSRSSSPIIINILYLRFVSFLLSHPFISLFISSHIFRFAPYIISVTDEITIDLERIILMPFVRVLSFLQRYYNSPNRKRSKLERRCISLNRIVWGFDSSIVYALIARSLPLSTRQKNLMYK